VQGSGRTTTNFHFELINVPVVNAFASPGGLVVTFSQLMLYAETESELAGVLAHEIAHVTQRHITRRMESSMEDVIPILLGTLALAVATRGEGDGAQAAMASGMALMQQSARSTSPARTSTKRTAWASRPWPRPASIRSAWAISSRASARLHRTGGEKPPEYLMTHPVSTTRVAEAKARADKLRKGTQLTSTEFKLMRERLRVITSTDLPALVRFYQDAQGARRRSIRPRWTMAWRLAQLAHRRPPMPRTRRWNAWPRPIRTG
jgi:predicted Zn-dependent protease